jgi:hypothetical protein
LVRSGQVVSGYVKDIAVQAAALVPAELLRRERTFSAAAYRRKEGQ